VAWEVSEGGAGGAVWVWGVVKIKIRKEGNKKCGGEYKMCITDHTGQGGGEVDQTHVKGTAGLVNRAKKKKMPGGKGVEKSKTKNKKKKTPTKQQNGGGCSPTRNPKDTNIVVSEEKTESKIIWKGGEKNKPWGGVSQRATNQRQLWVATC